MIIYSITQKSQLEEAERIDAEYFMPEFLDVATHLEKLHAHRLDSFGDITASAFYPSATGYYGGKGLPFIRVVDIVDYPVMDETQPFERLPKEFVESCSGIKTLKNGDLVISKVGTPCYAGIVNGNLEDVALSRTVLGIKKIHNINPLYLLAFLRSKYGFYQLMREREQQIQLQLTLDRVRRVRIFVPPEEAQSAVASMVLEYYKTLKKGKSLYSQAGELLLEELGLADEEFEDELTYVVDYSDAEEAERVDADYFQPKYEKLISKLKAQNAKQLGQLVSMKKGIEPGREAYQDEGKPFIRVSNISVEGLNDRDQKYLGENLYQKLKSDFEPKVGEVLLTKDATPGTACVLKEPIEGIIAGGILRVTSGNEVDPEYLALCINSIVGQLQMERDTSGSVIAHWRPSQIKNMLIPILPKPTQQKIADLVCQSHAARKESKQLLEEAKRKVENMIEKGGDYNV